MPDWASLLEIIHEPPEGAVAHSGELFDVSFDEAGQHVFATWEQECGSVWGDLMFAEDPSAFLDEACAALDPGAEGPEVLVPLRATAVQAVAGGIRFPADEVDFMALADALEEARAGQDMIDHCRRWPRHSRECWVVARARAAAAVET